MYHKDQAFVIKPTREAVSFGGVMFSAALNPKISVFGLLLKPRAPVGEGSETGLVGGDVKQVRRFEGARLYPQCIG